MWILTFNVVLGYQGLLFRDPISGNASDAKWKKRGMAKRFCSLWSSGTKLSYSLHVENTKHTQKNWLHFFFTWLFLYDKEVSRVFSSTSNIAWQFSFQWHRQCAILLQTQIHMYANLVEQNLILTLSWSLCLYFFKSCFLLDAVSEKYSYISLATLL